MELSHNIEYNTAYIHGLKFALYHMLKEERALFNKITPSDIKEVSEYIDQIGIWDRYKPPINIPLWIKGMRQDYINRKPIWSEF
jgi:hypothetical protein